MFGWATFDVVKRGGDIFLLGDINFGMDGLFYYEYNIGR